MCHFWWISEFSYWNAIVDMPSAREYTYVCMLQSESDMSQFFRGSLKSDHCAPSLPWLQLAIKNKMINNGITL